MMAGSKFRALFFDFDGTLVDSIALLYKAYIDFLKGYELEGTKAEFDTFNGPSLREITSIINHRYNLGKPDAVVYDEYQTLLTQYFSEKLSLKDHAAEVLHTCRAAGVQSYLITSSQRGVVERYITANKLEFDGFTFGDEVTNSKPSPDIYMHSLDKFRLNNLEVLVVEDSLNGILSAQNANLKVCGLLGTHTFAELQGINPDYIINSLDELQNIVLDQ